MSLRIINKPLAESVVHITQAGSYSIPITSLNKDANENVSLAAFKKVIWSTGGYIVITRGSEDVLELSESGEMLFTEIEYALSKFAGDSINVSVSVGGTIVMELAKQYDVPEFFFYQTEISPQGNDNAAFSTEDGDYLIFDIKVPSSS